MLHSKHKFDVITIGDVCVDMVLTGGDIVPEFGQKEKLIGDYVLEMGGSSLIFACQAAKLGLKVAVVGRVGTDQFGELVISRLQEAGVDTSYLIRTQDVRTGLGVILSKGEDRAILTYSGTIEAVGPEDVTDEFLSSSRHLHIGSYYLLSGIRPQFVDITQRARHLGLTVSLDTNWDPTERWNDGLIEMLRMVDYFFPNEVELCSIGRVHWGTKGLKDAWQRITQEVPIVALKRGAKETWAYRDHEVVSCMPFPTEVVDTIGAGDSFDAGFIYGCLTGVSLQDTLRYACACGTMSTRAAGGFQGQLDRSEAQKVVRERWMAL